MWQREEFYRQQWQRYDQPHHRELRFERMPLCSCRADWQLARSFLNCEINHDVVMVCMLVLSPQAFVAAARYNARSVFVTLSSALRSRGLHQRVLPAGSSAPRSMKCRTLRRAGTDFYRFVAAGQVGDPAMA